ncbi:uncharacterized protein [Henckelia pumila]|uniref:uncharacterized protein n=1 Tax=Henckelia pumila TaxID=405737 RepID=UPI003C6E7EF9
MESTIVHFGHEHPLMLEKSEEIHHRCNACGLYVMLSPCYMCTIQGCNFYLHQACSQLPHQLHHYYCVGRYEYVEKHDLALLSKPRNDNCLCGYCGKLCENFTYHCSECEFVVHPICGFPLDIQINHISHPQHPMLVFGKEASLLCDACGRKHEGYFFSCHKCNFWIHQECALLPSFVEVEEHQHCLSLLYSASSLLGLYIESDTCLICLKIAIIKSGIYYCFQCGILAHVDCAISRSRNKDSGAIFHMPIVSSDMFLGSILRAIEVKEGNSIKMLEKYHTDLSLVLMDDSTAQDLVCNACIQPIHSPPYYRCGAHSQCNFLLHKFCLDLPLSVKDSVYTTTTNNLFSPRLDEFFSLFGCFSCQTYCNGFGYLFGESDSIVDDVECSLAPRVINHDSHKQHPLILSTASTRNIESWKSCCGKSYSSYRYFCDLCNFMIHIDCARLPKSVTHKFDEHPLTLTFASSNSTDDDICEFCEEDIDSKYWLYHCVECDQSFHVKCIPSQGEFSKIKFGGSVEVPCHKDHPLTLVRMMNLGSQRCGYNCHEIIQGFEDGMALHCQDCDFWIHFHCGYRSCHGKVSLPYQVFSNL